MITNKDIEKLKNIFTTKQDLKLLEEKFVTKNEFNASIKELVILITGGFNRMDRAIDKIEELQKVQNNHGRRLDIIEDKVFV